MPFPDSQRVLYKKNPLERVICQLRFPTILRVDAEQPVNFQEMIRGEYPLFRERLSGSEFVPQQILKQMPSQLVEAIQRPTSRVFEFTSEDEKWAVVLTREFLAITTHEYTRWEQFSQHLETPLQALLAVYKPSFFSRVGLRYYNVIRRSSLGLDNVPWSELVQPYIAGELSDNRIRNFIQESGNNILIDLKEGEGRVRIQHGLVKDDYDEICYLIDSDFFTTKKTEVENVNAILTQFNRKTRRLFRWCISDKLHAAMEPETI